VVKVLFLFPSSADRQALDEFIGSTFAPGLRQAAGCRSVMVSQGDLMSPGGPPPYARVVEAAFDSLRDVIGAVEAPEAQSGRLQVRDLGTLVLMYEMG
jgi:uncharacterized protein (TIGR02118 family)